MDRTEHRIEALEQRTHLSVSSSNLPLSFDGPGFDSAQKIVPTADGFVVAGLFSGRVDFDPSAGRRRLTARGDTDIYVASFDGTGNFQWVTQFGGDHTDKAMQEFKRRDVLTNPRRLGSFIGRVGEQPREAGEYITDLKVDIQGNIVLGGAFKKTIQIGNRTLTADETIDEDFYDGMVVKLTANGALAWVYNFGGPFDDVAMSVGFDGAANVVVGGYFTRQADFDPGRRVLQLTTLGRDAGFVARLSALGKMSWVYQFGGESGDRLIRNAVNDVAVTARGEVYFGGTFGDTVDFDASKGVREIKSEGQNDAVLGKLNRKGALSWVVSTGGDQADGNSAVALDPSGNVYTAGYFTDEADVDPRPGVNKILKASTEEGDSKSDFNDILVSKFTTDGAPLWQSQMGGGLIELIADLEVAANGTIYTTGSFFGKADFSPGPGTAFLTSTATNDGSIKDSNTNFGRDESYDWFVVSLSPRGKFVAGAKFGGADDDFASGLGLVDNQVLLAGRQVNAVGERDDRDEQSLVRLLGANLA
ncbi:MAG: hypothetical protein H7144_09055 [Burkholderiales bacterium]|nr:hypothetical protein [Phycisphaerae bacterium]